MKLTTRAFFVTLVLFINQSADTLALPLGKRDGHLANTYSAPEPQSWDQGSSHVTEPSHPQPQSWEHSTPSAHYSSTSEHHSTPTYTQPAHDSWVYSPPAVHDTPVHTPSVVHETPVYTPPAVHHTPVHTPPAVHETPIHTPVHTPVHTPSSVHHTPVYTPSVVHHTPVYVPPAVHTTSSSVYHAPPVHNTQPAHYTPPQEQPWLHNPPPVVHTPVHTTSAHVSYPTHPSPPHVVYTTTSSSWHAVYTPPVSSWSHGQQQQHGWQGQQQQYGWQGQAQQHNQYPPQHNQQQQQYNAHMCDSGLTRRDGHSTKVPCKAVATCPPEREEFLGVLEDNISAGHILTNPSISVSWPSGSTSSQDKLTRMSTVIQTLQNLEGPYVGCPVVSTTFLKQYKKLIDGSVSVEDALEQDDLELDDEEELNLQEDFGLEAEDDSGVDILAEGGADRDIAAIQQASQQALIDAFTPEGIVEASLVPEFGEGQQSEGCPPDRDAFIRLLSTNVAAGFVLSDPTTLVSFPTGDDNESRRARLQAALDTLTKAVDSCPAESTTFEQQLAELDSE